MKVKIDKKRKDLSLEQLVKEHQKAELLHRRLPRHRKGELFLKGPIPRDWYLLAGGLPGKAAVLGEELWHQAFLDEGYRTFKLKLKKLPSYLNKQTRQRALRVLELAGLISIEHHPGQSLLITINDCPDIRQQMGL